MKCSFRRNLSLLALAAASSALLSLATPAQAIVVDLGQASKFTLLALGGGITDSGPVGPQGDPYTVNGSVGIVTAGEKFQASGSVTYNGSIFLHTGVTFNRSAQGVPTPMMSSSIDAMRNQ